MKIVFVANTSWYLYNFRVPLMNALKVMGHTVYAAAPKDAYSEKLEKLGIIFCEWHIGRTNVNPLTELFALFELQKILQHNKVDLALSYTPKGNIHTSISCMFSRKKVINNISGLGISVTKKAPLSTLLYHLYRFLLRYSDQVFFQNEDDRNFLLKGLTGKIIKSDSLPGSGVDVQKFSNNFNTPKPKYHFLLSARLLREKGVYEYIEASKIILKKYPKITFAISGQIENNSKSGIDVEDIEKWDQEGIAEYLGFTDDIRSFLLNTKCFVLPSYYGEGVPRGLLEAASLSIPLITTDHPGCRDAVDDGISGFLCAVKNPIDLAQKMEQVLEMSISERKEMGRHGRAKMVNNFDEKIIISKYVNLIEKIDSYKK